MAYLPILNYLYIPRHAWIEQDLSITLGAPLTWTPVPWLAGTWCHCILVPAKMPTFKQPIMDLNIPGLLQTTHICRYSAYIRKVLLDFLLNVTTP